MRKCVAIYGATHEALQLVSVLEANPDIEIASVFDPDLEAARGRIESLDPVQPKYQLSIEGAHCSEAPYRSLSKTYFFVGAYNLYMSNINLFTASP